MKEIDFFEEIFYEEKVIQEYCDNICAKLQNSINQVEELKDKLEEIHGETTSGVNYQNDSELREYLDTYDDLKNVKRKYKQVYLNTNREFQEFQHKHSASIQQYIEEQLDQLVPLYEEMNIPEFQFELESLMSLIR